MASGERMGCGYEKPIRFGWAQILQRPHAMANAATPVYWHQAPSLFEAMIVQAGSAVPVDRSWPRPR